MAKAAITVQAKDEVKLETRLAKQLKTDLDDYLEVALQIQALEEEANKLKESIEAKRGKAGHKSFKLEDFGITRVEGTRTIVDTKYMIDEGWISSEQLEEATRTVPKKAYTLITHPKLRKKKE